VTAMGIAPTMPGVFLPGDSTAELRTYRRPEPGPGQVLLAVGASGICGSDIGYIYRGYRSHKGLDGAPAYRGVIAGHEPSGTVLATGPGCRRLRDGDRVIVYHVVGCGRCRNCRAGYYISCSDEARRAAYGWQRDGGHAPYLLAEESTCIPLPDALSFVDGSLIACGFGTAYEGLRRARVDGSDTLLVVGLGPVGLAAAMIGRCLGVGRVLGVERTPQRAEFVRSTGLVDEIISADGDPATVTDAVLSRTGGRGCSVTVDCSGATAGRSIAVGAVAEWGRVSLLGESGRLETEVSDSLLHKQVTIHASWVTSLPAMEDLAQLLAAGEFRPETVVSHRFGLDDADQAYRLAAAGAAGKVVLLPGKAA
jgi:threonine dehydrogenase-like Zn-dependent dehydrogenase